MTRTLLNGVNEVLKRAGRIKNSTLFTSLTDTSRQPDIDLTVQVINELIDHLYERAHTPRPNVLSSNTITLATDDRDYALQTDVIVLHWPFHDVTNGRFIERWPGDFQSLYHRDTIPANQTGMPTMGAISPEDGEVYLDAIPTSAENGLVYTYWYEADPELTTAAQLFPFSDAVFRALVPAGAQLWRRERHNSFDEGIFNASLGRAARLMRQEPLPQSWHPFVQQPRGFDPVGE